MRTHAGTLLALALAVRALPASADLLDQSYLGPDEGVVAISAIFARAQTFTVGVEGELARIGLVLSAIGVTEEDELVVDVRPTDELGAPLADDGAALGSVSVPATRLPTSLTGVERFEIDFSSFAIAVTPGEELAIVARSNVPYLGERQIYWAAHVSESDGYADGDAWYRDPGWSLQDGGGTDLLFETFVAPEPSAAAGAACAALLALAWRRGHGATSRFEE